MIKLRHYQTESIKRTIDHLTKYKLRHPLIALPTGAGKSYVISGTIEAILTKWPDANVLVLSHVREILEQDHDSIVNHLTMDVGLYSAGLGKREVKKITVAGIQSVYNKPNLFDDFKFVIIDECHLIPPGDNTMYRKFFAKLKNTRYMGLTATPFRLGLGYIYGEQESLFTDLIYDLTSKENFVKLIEDGYLCRLKTQATSVELEADDIRIVAGDFDKKILSKKFDVASITKKAVAELVQKGQDYKKWLIFAIDIEHANHIALELAEQGISAMAIHSKMEFDRGTVIKHAKEGTFRAIVNVGMLTTGYDDPSIDLIALLRPTQSPIIHVQTVGRGLRINPGKDHCLILDFAGNTERLGPINDIHVRRKGEGKKGGEPITKRCPICDTIHPPMAKICDNCGHKFVFQTKLKSKAGNAEIIAEKKTPWFKVDSTSYGVRVNGRSPPMLQVNYQCGLRVFKEYVCIEHKGYAGARAHHWLKYRGVERADTAKSALDLSATLKTPARIKVDNKGKYPDITDYSF